MIKVIIVDDSPVQLKLMDYIISLDNELKVIAIVNSGYELLEILEKKTPDIILMDINMPKMNGFVTAQKILEKYALPIILTSATWELDDAKDIIKSMELGVLAILAKPHAITEPSFESEANILIQTLKELSEVKIVRRFSHKNSSNNIKKIEQPFIENFSKNARIVFIGCSAGGPPALKDILSNLSSEFNLPILVVQHMTDGFIEMFATWLNENCKLNVKVIEDNEILKNGNVYIVPNDFDIVIKNDNSVTLNKIQNRTIHLTSISKAMQSVKQIYGKNSIAVILSGMGADGVKELKELRELGALTISQNKETSIVYGMPMEAAKLDAAVYILSPLEISKLLNSYVEDKS